MPNRFTKTAGAALPLALALCLAALPAAAASRPAAQPEPPAWGIVLRGGWYGLPDIVADELFIRHPSINGAIYGAELRYSGTGGNRGIASFGIAVDHASTKADGVWQEKKAGNSVVAEGKIDFTSITLNGYWNILPSWYVHPYLGIGIGAADYTGSYSRNGDLVEVNTWLPVLNIPIGLAIPLGDHAELAAEVRLLNGVAVGGALQLLF